MIFIERIRYKYYKEFLTMSKYYSINEFSKNFRSFSTNITKLGQKW